MKHLRLLQTKKVPQVQKKTLVSKARVFFFSKKFIRQFSIVTLAIVTIASFVITSSTSVFAAVKYSDLTIPEKASVYESGLILEKCLGDLWVRTNIGQVREGRVGMDPYSTDKVAVWDKTIINYHASLRDEDNVMDCTEYSDALIKGAIKRLKINPEHFVCAMGAERVNGTSAANCSKSSDSDFTYSKINNQDNKGFITEAKLRKYLKDEIGLDLNNPGNAVRYWRSYNIVSNYCAAKDTITRAEWDQEDGNNRYDYKNPSTGETEYHLAKSKKDDKPVYKGQGQDSASQQGDITCRTYWERMKQFYPDYERYVDSLSPEEKEEEKDAQENSQAPIAPDDSPTTCVVDGIGWIVCPIVNTSASIVDGLYTWISSYLRTPPLNTDVASSSNTLYIAWSAMRTVANVAFVIAFLVIIYSQLAGGAVTNYGIKKMLPRLIIAAILVNVSYWVCAVAVDLSNIIGKGIYETLTSIRLGPITIESNAWETFLGFLLAGAATGAVVVAGFTLEAGMFAGLAQVAMWIAIVFVLSALLALIVAFIILAVRQALIILLIMVSPLAFVAFLLPNTEKFFTTWRKALTTALIFYPLFSILFGGATVASRVILGTADPSNNGGGMIILIGMAVQVVPLFLTPLIIKFSSGVLGTLAGMVNNKQRGLIDRARNTRNRKASLLGHEAFGGAKAARNPFGRLYRRINNSSRGDAMRQQTINNNNDANFANSDGMGRQLNYENQISSEAKQAAEGLNQVQYQESLSEAQGLPSDQKKAALIAQARQFQEEKNINAQRKGSAERVLSKEFAQALNDPSSRGMAVRSGGIDPAGESRVRAAAMNAEAKAQSDGISAEATLMSNYDSSQLHSVLQSKNSTVEQRAAAAVRIAKSGSDGDIAKALDYVGNPSNGISAEDLETIQSNLGESLGARKPMGLGAGNMAELGRGVYRGPLSEKLTSRLRAGKLSGAGLHSATPDDLDMLSELIENESISNTDPQLIKLREQVTKYQSSANYQEPPKEILDRIAKIM